jgi:pyruvate/2-oxoglutarate dehydrogenase complex dihydrolipoamide acyltransferase (E2) component
VPAHSSSPRHPLRWAVVVAVAAVVALVLIVRPALGPGRSTPAAATAPATTAATGTTVPPTPPAAPTPTTTAASPTVPPTSAPAKTPGAAIPDSASGRLATVPGEVAAAGPGTTIRYRLEIEAGLPLDGPAIATQVQATLTDPRGWEPIEHVAFARTAGPASFELIIASPTLVDKLCYPLDTIGQLSCRNGDKVILNARRWATAVPWYTGHLDAYRAYLVNHEVGHRLGHGHKTCPSPGAPAPVMVQQSKSLYGCTANPWPSVAY